jgi:hypothetical protein
MEEIVGDPTSVKSPFKMWRPRKSYIVACKAYSQEIEESSREQGMDGLAQPPNIKSVTAKVGTQSNMSYKPGKSYVMLHNQKRATTA